MSKGNLGRFLGSFRKTAYYLVPPSPLLFPRREVVCLIELRLSNLPRLISREWKKQVVGAADGCAPGAGSGLQRSCGSYPCLGANECLNWGVEEELNF